MNREADLRGMFKEQLRLGNLGILAREKPNRRIDSDILKLFHRIRAVPFQAHLNVHIQCLFPRRVVERSRIRWCIED